jgi:ADP-heptose:LPS heptosyltransferase
MAEKPYSSILRGHPGLEGIVEIERGLRGTLSSIRELRKLEFTAAVDLFYNPRSANILKMSGIPVRIGGSRKWRRRFYTHNFKPPASARSAILHHLSALDLLGCGADQRRPRVYLSEEERETGYHLAHDLLAGSETHRILALHPGGTWPSKRWSPDLFARLSREAAKKFGAGTLIITGPGEEKIARHVEAESGGSAARMPCVTIREAAAVISACGALVANDGGVMHASVALGIPTIGIFGPTERDIWFPYEGMGPYKVVTCEADCAPCHLHECNDMRCLEGISVRNVIDALASATGW